MEDRLNIEFIRGTGKYKLHLPETVTSDLLLMDERHQPLEILHENKMELEWLSADIINRHKEFLTSMEKAKRRRRIKMTIAAAILLLIAIATFMSRTLAELFKIPFNIFNLLIFLVGIVTLWQVFQLYVLGGVRAPIGLMDDLKTIELKERIREKFQ